MPKPVYIICCEKSITDKEDNLISILSVIEKFTVEIDSSSLSSDPDKKILLKKDFQTVVGWLREEDEVGDEFESNLMIVTPDGTEMHTESSHPIKFDKDKPLHRITYRVPGIPMGGDGVYRVIGRIRNLTTKGGWVTQEFLILVETIIKQQVETSKQSVE